MHLVIDVPLGSKDVGEKGLKTVGDSSLLQPMHTHKFTSLSIVFQSIGIIVL